jgi:hypothetical protein
MPGIGIVFNIDDLGGGFYGYQAWKIFMKHIDVRKFPASALFEGDTNETLGGSANEFCIAIYGMIDIGKIKDIFKDLNDKGLAQQGRRFIDKPRLDAEPLPSRGRIDAAGFFVTDKWTRVDHDLCKENGWGYKPQKVTVELNADLRRELDELMRDRFPGSGTDQAPCVAPPAEQPIVPPNPQKKPDQQTLPTSQKWWQFWR